MGAALRDDPRDIQPPIADDEELANYRLELARFDVIVANREKTLFESQSDAHALASARQGLYRVYRQRQGIIDAIEAYERRCSVSTTRALL
ncbi:MAG TPA: hypothetical protein VMV29_11255 [Ktedonobacterales bacterium]|nr:hypothetical protein [Ktedonobacterales bacterium]